MEMGSSSVVTECVGSGVFSIANKALRLSSKEDAEQHLKELCTYDKVTKIDLSGNTIGVGASAALACYITESAVVRENVVEINFADLYTSRLVDEVVESLNLLLPALLKCTKLESLNLSDNAFGSRTIDILERYISNAVNLKHLILSNNGMGPFAGERIGKALYILASRKLRAQKPMLETFICGRNRLENDSAKFLALGLKKHGEGLKVVRLYQNGIRPGGLVTLLKYGLKFNNKLEVLDLQDNTFTSSASEVLADVLPLWKDTLKELNVNDCLLRAKGSDVLVKVLSDHKFAVLEKLKLQYNEMRQKTVESFLIPAMKNGNISSLKLLELNGNCLEENSEALDALQLLFKGEPLELIDFEEIVSDYENDEEPELLKETDLGVLESDMSRISVADLIKELANTHIDN